MAKKDHVALLASGVSNWNQSRPDVVDLSGARLRGFDLQGFDLRGANLRNANLQKADLRGAQLLRSDLRGAQLSSANFSKADLRGARLAAAVMIKAKFVEADLSYSELLKVNAKRASFRKATLDYAAAAGAEMSDAILTRCSMVAFDADSAVFRRATLLDADLQGAWLAHCDFTDADMRRSFLVGASFYDARLHDCDFGGVDLRCADLRLSSLVGANLDGCWLTGSAVFGVSAWALQGTPVDQTALLLSHRAPDLDLLFSCESEEENAADDENRQALEDGDDEVFKPWASGRLKMTEIYDSESQADVQVDDLEVAQFIHLLLNRRKLRNVIDTITSKAVLILGRFTRSRKPVLDAVAEELRADGLVPIIFDFERADSRDFTETIRTLAGMSLFVVVDITNPKSAPLELQATVPDYRIPFVPIIEVGENPFAMFVNLQRSYDWVLPVLEYESVAQLREVFAQAVIAEARKCSEQLTLDKAKTVVMRRASDYVT